MTHFRVSIDLTCPSNWTEEDAEAYIAHLAPQNLKFFGFRVIRVKTLDTFCKSGRHKLEPPNLIINSYGFRQCRACAYERNNLRRRKA